MKRFRVLLSSSEKTYNTSMSACMRLVFTHIYAHAHGTENVHSAHCKLTSCMRQNEVGCCVRMILKKILFSLNWKNLFPLNLFSDYIWHGPSNLILPFSQKMISKLTAFYAEIACITHIKIKNLKIERFGFEWNRYRELIPKAVFIGTLKRSCLLYGLLPQLRIDFAHYPVAGSRLQHPHTAFKHTPTRALFQLRSSYSLSAQRYCMGCSLSFEFCAFSALCCSEHRFRCRCICVTNLFSWRN